MLRQHVNTREYVITAASLLKSNLLRTQRGTAFQVLLKFACDSIKAIFSGAIASKELEMAAFSYKHRRGKIIYALLRLLSPFIWETKGCVNLLFKVTQHQHLCRELGSHTAWLPRALASTTFRDNRES